VAQLTEWRTYLPRERAGEGQGGGRAALSQAWPLLANLGEHQAVLHRDVQFRRRICFRVDENSGVQQHALGSHIRRSTIFKKTVADEPDARIIREKLVVFWQFDVFQRDQPLLVMSRSCE
jgi:hypothetical protein